MWKIQVLSRAEIDLFDIEIHTHKTWGSDKVEEMLKEMNRTFEIIASSPFLGRTTRNKNVFVKTLTKLPFVVVYKINDNVISIVQITHTKRNR